MQKILHLRYLILFIVLVTSCQLKNNKTLAAKSVNQDSLVIYLVKNDFLIYVDSTIMDSVRKSFINSGYIFSPEINRYVHIDAEELAEGSFGFFRNDLTKILNVRGINISFGTTKNFEKYHEVKINNTVFNIYDKIHLSNYSFWDEDPRRFFKILNQELEFNKSKERFYLIYSGNDLGALLLTDQQFKIIEAINQGNQKEIPYQP